MRLAAFDALTSLAGTKELDPVVACMKQAKDDGERKAVEGVLLSIFFRTRDQHAYSAAVLKGLAGIDRLGRVSLVRVLGPAGGGESLRVLRKALAGSDQLIRTAAIEALA
ncbi:hypothetical protein ACFLQU_05665, partial [Verrucomicrobiota bacterium]